MRVTYGRSMQMKAFLDAENIENFLPMTVKVTQHDGKMHRAIAPAISNLLFVRSTRSKITWLKQHTRAGEPLRYMMRQSVLTDSPAEIITVPDRQMDNFIKAATAMPDGVTFYNTCGESGQKKNTVVITSGPFCGVRGVIKRIRGNKHVTIEIDGVAGLAINFIPKSFIKEER